MDKREILRIKIEGLREFSTVSAVLNKVIDIVDDESSSVEDLEMVIEHDQALAARIVRMANAAFYGQSRNVDDISRAIMILGSDMVKCIAIAVSVFDTKNRGHLRELNKMWCHSFYVATASGKLAEKTGLVKNETAFFAGLIHDMGRVILYNLFHNEYMNITFFDMERLLSIEEERFGAPHPLAGAWFAERCLFPEGCVRSTEFHHNPEVYLSNKRYQDCHLIPIVYLADFLASRKNKGFDADCMVSDFHNEALEGIGMDETGLEDVSAIMDDMEDEMKGFYEIFNGVG